MFRLFGLLLVGLVSQSHFSVAIASEGQTISCNIKGSNINTWSSAVVHKSIQLEIERYFVKSVRPGRAIAHLDGGSIYYFQTINVLEQEFDVLWCG
jgi:hypothetical protein